MTGGCTEFLVRVFAGGCPAASLPHPQRHTSQPARPASSRCTNRHKEATLGAEPPGPPRARYRSAVRVAPAPVNGFVVIVGIWLLGMSREVRKPGPRRPYVVVGPT